MPGQVDSAKVLDVVHKEMANQVRYEDHHDIKIMQTHVDKLKSACSTNQDQTDPVRPQIQQVNDSETLSIYFLEMNKQYCCCKGH